MTNAITALADMLLPRRYGQFVAALVARTLLLLLLLMLGACAALPGAAVRPVSTALTGVDDTPLARTARASTPMEQRSLHRARGTASTNRPEQPQL